MSRVHQFRTAPAILYNARRRMVIGLCVLVISATAGFEPARAVDYTWTGAINASFWIGSNWTPSGGPPNDNTDNAIFTANPSAVYTVEWKNNRTIRSLEARAGDVTLFGIQSSTFTLDSAPFPSAVIGSMAGPLAQLTVGRQFNSSPSIVSNGPLRIGDPVGSNGELTIDGISWDSSSVALVGWNGTGELVFVNGGTLTTTGGTLGIFAGSSGTVTASSGTWTNTGVLTVGDLGTGVLNISGGGDVSNDGRGNIGKGSSGVGVVNVTGIGQWQNNASLYVGGHAGGAGGTGTLTVGPGSGATVTCVNILKLYAGSSLNLSGGTVNAGVLIGDSNALNWTAGTLNITGVGVFIDPGEVLGNAVQIGSGQTLSVSGLPGALDVGTNVGATLTVIGGGTVTSGTGLIGSVNGGSVVSTARITGSGSTWTMSGDVGMRSVNGAHLIVENGGVVSNEDALIAWLTSTTADIDLTGAGSQWNSSGSVYLGGDAVLSGGNGELHIVNEAAMNVAGTLKIWEGYFGDVSGGGVLTASNLDLRGGLSVDTGTMEILGGTVNIIGSDAFAEGAMDIQGSALNITGGGQFFGTILGDGNTQVALQDSDSTWWTQASLDVGTSTAGPNQIGTLAVPTGAVVAVEGAVTLLAPGALTLSGGSIDATEFDFSGIGFQGFGALNGRMLGGDRVITATGDLTMGDTTNPLGFYHAGGLQVGANTVMLNSAGFARPGTLTTLQAGGTLAAPNGLLLDNGDNLSGAGTVIAPIAAGLGSRITVGEGELHLGDPTAPDGFFSDGVLEIGSRSVTLHDANEAVLGSLTTLGFGDFAGSLAAENGAVLEFGKNLAGFGIVNTPNDPTAPLINNGSIVGDAAVRPIELSGYVKGVGTLDNVNITGTDAPGFSPATVYRGNVTYGGTVVIEIGGLSAGSGYDQIIHSGAASLGGELHIALINGFAPQVGDSFVILTFVSHTGQFSSVTGTGNCNGPVFRVDYTDTSVTLTVVDPLPADVDVDGDVDLSDYSIFAGCITGPNGAVAGECQCFDLDQNGRVDVQDFGGLQTAFTGQIH